MNTIKLGIKVGIVWFVAEITRAAVAGICTGIYKGHKKFMAERKEATDAEKKDQTAENEEDFEDFPQ